MTHGNFSSVKWNVAPWKHSALCRKFPVPEWNFGLAVGALLFSFEPGPRAAAFLPLDSCQWNQVNSTMLLNCMATVCHATHSCCSCDWSPTTKPNQARSTCISTCHQHENDESRCCNDSLFSTPASARLVPLRQWSYQYQRPVMHRPDDETRICRESNLCSRKFCPSTL